ncbi:MAG: hypothetical protein ABJA83_09235 [Burkholderiaceae bacterium]
MHLPQLAVTAAALALSTVVTATELSPDQLQTYGPLKQPRPVQGVKPLPNPGIDALRGEGIFLINGARVANLRASDKPGPEDRYALTETTNDAKTGAVHSNIDAGNFVLNGERRPVGRPNFAIPAPDGTIYLIFSGQHPLRVAVTLQAFDVSGLPMQPFLRTPDNYLKQEAAKVGGAVFPKDSVAYLVVARFIDDVLMLPARESFTGATSTVQFVGNFSKQIPYCLSYEDRKGAKPYAMFFKPGAAKKGVVDLYPAKTGTLFCDREGAKAVDEGEWEERTISGTRAVVLSFPANVDPLDTGVTNVERESAKIAFIEPSKGAPGVRPGKLYQAGAKIYDYQYRFNKTAAEAVRSALGSL